MAFGGSHVCGPFFLTERMVSSKKLPLENCQVSSSWYNKKSNQGCGSYRVSIFLSLQFSPPRGSDSLIIRLYIAPALLQHNASHNSNKTIYYVINGLIFIYMARW